MWTKIFCPQKSGRNLGSEDEKMLPISDDREHFMLFWGKNLTSEIPQQQQPRKRSYRPWGCYQRPGSPSSQRQIRLAAALGLRRRDFWSRKPDFSQNKKYIARKQYVVLSFHGDILSHHVFTKQGVLT